MSCRFGGQVGDRGQRYEIRYHVLAELPATIIASPGFGMAGEERVLGWAATLPGAEKMAAAWREAPSVYDVWVVDREAFTVRKLAAALLALPEADQDKIVTVAALEDEPEFPWTAVTNIGRTPDGRICID